MAILTGQGVSPILILLLANQVLAVGPGRRFERIEDAVRAAKPGDTVAVYPQSGGYREVALKLTVPRLKLIGQGPAPVELDGTGFDYSGAGRVPRAIIQVDATGVGATIGHFVLRGAHNGTHNGAGIRVNGADGVTVDGCEITGNDMGVMSNGGPEGVAKDQLFRECHIHRNGDAADPGYNHNLYLGGESATLRHCEIDHSLTGHNVKSRAHFTLVQDCFVHDSANREFDFVEAAETERPNSNAAIVNTLIVKAADCSGNRGVIHFGRERGVRLGGIWLIHCTLRTSFASGVLSLDGSSVHAEFDDDVIENGIQETPSFVEASGGASLAAVFGRNNWLSPGYAIAETRIDRATRWPGSKPPASVGIPNPSYYRDGQGKEWEVTPSSYLGALWRPLRGA